MEEMNASQLGSLIVDNRHFVNTIFLEKYGEELLTLPQERNLVDFFKSANSEDEFSMRVISLGSSAREMNISKLRSLTEIKIIILYPIRYNFNKCRIFIPEKV